MELHKRSVFAALSGVALCFALASALYTRDSITWGGQEFRLEAARTDVGLPLPWLSVTTHWTRGVVPPPAELPEYGPWEPGVHLRPLGLVIVLAVSAGSGIGLGKLLLLSLGAGGMLATRSSRLRLLGLLLLAIGVGSVTPTRPEWIGACLVLGLVPVVLVAATWPDTKVTQIMVFAAATSLSAWWGAKMGDHFRTQHLCTRFVVMELAAFPVLLFSYALPALVVLGVRAFLRRRKVRAQPARSTDAAGEQRPSDHA